MRRVRESIDGGDWRWVAKVEKLLTGMDDVDEMEKQSKRYITSSYIDRTMPPFPQKPE